MAQSSFDWGSFAGGALQTISNIWGNNPKASSPIVINSTPTGSSGGSNTSFNLGGSSTTTIIIIVAAFLLLGRGRR